MQNISSIGQKSFSRHQLLYFGIGTGNAAVAETIFEPATVSKIDAQDFGRLIASNMHEEAIALVRQGKVDINPRQGITPLMQTAEKGERMLPLLRVLINHGADLNAVRPDQLQIRKGNDDLKITIGRTPLSNAAGSGSIPVMEALIEAGAQVNPNPDNTDWTPLMAAALEGHEKAVSYLLAKNRFNTENDAAWPDIVESVYKGDFRMAREIGMVQNIQAAVKKKPPADASIVHKESGLTARGFALLRSYYQITRLLPEPEPSKKKHRFSEV